MEIRFKITLDHLLVFARHFYSSSPTIRRARRRQRVIIGAMFFTVFSLMWLAEEPNVAHILFWYLVGAGYVLFVGYMHKRGYLKSFSRIYNEGENKGVIGEHVMTVGDSGIIDKTEGGESLTRWNSIGPIVGVDGCTLAYTGSATAHVIPADSVIEGDYGLFVDCLRKHHRIASEAAADAI